MSLVSKCIDEEFRGFNLLINLVLIFIGLKQNIVPVYQYWCTYFSNIVKVLFYKTLKEEDKKRRFRL